MDAVELGLVETVEAVDPAETAVAENQFVAVETAAAEDPVEIETVAWLLMKLLLWGNLLKSR